MQQSLTYMYKYIHTNPYSSNSLYTSRSPARSSLTYSISYKRQKSVEIVSLFFFWTVPEAAEQAEHVNALNSHNRL